RAPPRRDLLAADGRGRRSDPAGPSHRPDIPRMSESMKMRIQRGRVCSSLALAFLLTAASGCDSLLDVNLPAQLTDEALGDPKGAAVRLTTVIAHFESAYASHPYRTLGGEGGGEVYLCGPMCSVSNYVAGFDAFPPFSQSLSFAQDLHQKLSTEWT